MSELERYPYAPILEAIVLLRIHGEDGGAPGDMRLLSDQFKAALGIDFVGEQSWYRVSDELVTVDGVDSAMEDGHPLVGFGLTLNARERIMLVDDEFQYRHLYTSDVRYESWELVTDRALSLFGVLLELAGSAGVSGVGSRYVNQLPAPFDQDRFEIGDYVRMAPDVPGTLPQRVAGFFSQVDIPFEGPDGVASTRTTIYLGPFRVEDVEAPALILDIEVRKVVEPMSLKEIGGVLDEVRSVKNRVFEGTITDACRIRMRGLVQSGGDAS